MTTIQILRPLCECGEHDKTAVRWLVAKYRIRADQALWRLLAHRAAMRRVEKDGE